MFFFCILIFLPSLLTTLSCDCYTFCGCNFVGLVTPKTMAEVQSLERLPMTLIPGPPPKSKTNKQMQKQQKHKLLLKWKWAHVIEKSWPNSHLKDSRSLWYLVHWSNFSNNKKNWQRQKKLCKNLVRWKWAHGYWKVMAKQRSRLARQLRQLLISAFHSPLTE